MALNVVFPRGHKAVFDSYQDYRSAKQFRLKMELSNKLVTRLKIYQKREILTNFDKFLDEVNHSLLSDIENRALVVKNRQQAESDLAIIPDAFNLRDRYKEVLLLSKKQVL